MFGKVLFIGMSFILVACADKNYAEEKDLLAGSQKAEASCPFTFAQRGLCFDFDWEKYPTESETGSFIIRFWSASAQGEVPMLQTPSEDLAVVLWMSSMGHGSAPVQIENIGTGLFRVSRVFFTMRGDWEIRFQLKQGHQVVEQSLYNLIF